jgi:hypothetical protein
VATFVEEETFQVQVAADPRLRYVHALDLTEATLRYLGAVAMADDLSSGASIGTIDGLLESNPRPTVGTWVRIVRDISKAAETSAREIAVPLFREWIRENQVG